MLEALGARLLVELLLAGEIPVVGGGQVEDLGVMLSGAAGRFNRGCGLVLGHEDALADPHVHDRRIQACGERDEKREGRDQADETTGSH